MRARLPSTAFWAALACLWASHAQGLTLDADFDHGSLDASGSSVVGQLVSLAGRDNFNPGAWKWLYFRADEVAGFSPVFQIGDNFATGGSDLNDHAMVYSYDGQTWEFFDNNVRDAPGDRFRFWNDSAFIQDNVYVAYGLPYALGRVAQHTASLASSPWVEPTPSGSASLVVGASPGGVDDLGRTIAPQDLFGYRIADDQGADQRAKVVLAGGVHANETLGSYALEGLVDFLVSDSLEAALVRKVADILVYPMVNPDGRLAGYNRSTVARPDDDPNRFWDPPVYGGVAELETVGGAMLADTDAEANYLIDFHSTVVGKSGHYGFVLPAMQSDPLWRNFLALEPDVDTRNALLEDATLAKFGRDVLGAAFSITFETQFIAGENVDRFLGLGESFGLAIFETLVTFADLDLDGAVDRDDWMRLIASAEADLSAFSAVDAYLHGDLDGDAANSIADFALFKSAYDVENGHGAFAHMLAAPAPAGASLVAAAAAALSSSRHLVSKRRSPKC